ncbi:MAG: UDP-N-acetylglucosamine 2-epimerase [Candidatus Bathyarchaeia archaeon]
MQEETCILGLPCITLRDGTERPETLDVGSNILAGTDPNKILEAAKISCATKKTWANPFGEGKTGSKIINILRNELK